MKIDYEGINYSLYCLCEMAKLYLTNETFTIITINLLSFIQNI